MQRRELCYKEESGKLTGHLVVKELQLVEQLDTLRFELSQLGFGFLGFGIVLLTLGFQLLVVLCAVLEGSCSNVALLLRLASGRKSLFKIFLQNFMKLGAPFNVFLEPLDLGLMPLFLLLRLGFTVRKLVFQLQVLKNEQLEKLAMLIMRLLQDVTRARLKGSRGLAPEF